MIWFCASQNRAGNDVHLVSITKPVIVPVREECVWVSGIKFVVRESLQGETEKEVWEGGREGMAVLHATRQMSSVLDWTECWTFVLVLPFIKCDLYTVMPKCDTGNLRLRFFELPLSLHSCARSCAWICKMGVIVTLLPYDGYRTIAREYIKSLENFKLLYEHIASWNTVDIFHHIEKVLGYHIENEYNLVKFSPV